MLEVLVRYYRQVHLLITGLQRISPRFQMSVRKLPIQVQRQDRMYSTIYEHQHDA